jgi:hypothetical protein
MRYKRPSLNRRFDRTATISTIQLLLVWMGYDAWGTLWDPVSGIHKPGRAYEEVQKWLVGSRILEKAGLEHHRVRGDSEEPSCHYRDGPL